MPRILDDQLELVNAALNAAAVAAFADWQQQQRAADEIEQRGQDGDRRATLEAMMMRRHATDVLEGNRVALRRVNRWLTEGQGK